MLTKIIILSPDAPRSELTIELPFSVDLDLTRQIVEPYLGRGVNLERVAVLLGDKACDMFVDEDFHAKGLALNVEATAVYHEAARRRGVTNENVILGAAVLFTRKIWF